VARKAGASERMAVRIHQSERRRRGLWILSDGKFRCRARSLFTGAVCTRLPGRIRTYRRESKQKLAVCTLADKTWNDARPGCAWRVRRERAVNAAKGIWRCWRSDQRTKATTAIEFSEVRKHVAYATHRESHCMGCSSIVAIELVGYLSEVSDFSERRE